MTKRGVALATAALLFLLAAVPALGQGVPYPDVSPDHWAYEAIERLHHAGLIEGYPDGTFGGERTFTRYEMAMVFDRILSRLDRHMEAALAELGIDVDEITAEFGPELGLVNALAKALGDAQRASQEAKALAEEAAASADNAADRAYRARLAAESALAQARKANDTAAMAAALAGADGADLDGADPAQVEEVRLAAQRAQRVAADAEAAALRANAVAEMALQTAQDADLSETVEALRAAAQRAQRVAADAEAAALKAQAMAERALTVGDAEAALSEADSAAERAYRARLTAEQALALGRDADDKASRALALGEIAIRDAASVAEVAQEALDTALQADRLAYLAHLTAERALDTADDALAAAAAADRLAYLAHLSAERALDEAEGAHDRLDGVEGQLKTMPKLSGEVSANYEGAHTNQEGKLIDPRGAASGPKTKNASDITVGVGLKAVVEPKDGVRVEGGIKFSRNVFSGNALDVRLGDLYAQVTTPGVLQKAYFGGLSGELASNGFNKFVLDGATYETSPTKNWNDPDNVARVAPPHRAGAFAEFKLGALTTKVLTGFGKAGEDAADPTQPADPEKLFGGVSVNAALAEGMNINVSFLRPQDNDPTLGFGVFGEAGSLTYDWAFGQFKGDTAMDGSFSADIGTVTVGFKHRSIGEEFKASNRGYFGKVYTDKDDGIAPGKKDSELSLQAPVFGLDAEYLKGRFGNVAGTTYTDWQKIGFADADILGFGLSAHYYTDKDQADVASKAYRVGVDRTIQLGLPLKFSFVHANMDADAAQPVKTHMAVGVAVEDYAVSENLTLNAGYKLERNPLAGDWTDHSKWTVDLKDDEYDADAPDPSHVYVIGDRDRTTMHVGAKLDAGALTLSGGYEVVNNETDKGQVDVKTTDLGAAYSFNFLEGDVTLGYDWQKRVREGAGFDHGLESPRSTYSVGYERAAWGGTVDLGYKYVTGRGDDGANKKDAKDATAHLNYKYPVADGMDFTLGGQWTDSTGDTKGDYYFASVKAGFSLKF